MVGAKSLPLLNKFISQCGCEVCCSGLFLSARWFVASDAGKGRVNIIVLPDKDSAEYCSADLYNLTEGDCVFFLPDSGKRAERSNYKSSLGVQRTSAISKLSSVEKGETLFIVTYPDALEEPVPSEVSEKAVPALHFQKDYEYDRDEIIRILDENGFERVDFVSEPGQFTVRGALIDIFSYSESNPYRISFFGDEVEKITVFNCNTQLSVSTSGYADIYTNMSCKEDDCGKSVTALFPPDSLLWLDTCDVYSQSSFYPLLSPFSKVYIQAPLDAHGIPAVKFNINPQPTFNKNFELLSMDVRRKIDEGYSVLVYGEKKSQLERLKSILSEESLIVPEFVPGKNIHNGFIDSDNLVCCYSDHEIFDRFHRVSIRRTVEKSEQLTVNDLTSFNIGDYVVHIDYGVGVFGGLVRMADDKGRYHEVVKLCYKDNDVVFISVHSLHKISRFKPKDAEPPRINKLGSKAWQNLKAGAKSKVKDIAKDLIKLYAQRKAAEGFAFSPDTYMQKELESSFMYEDTPDQEKAVMAVKRDMEDSCPMDRLVCGDVGFGKTEVAIRAAFKAVADSKQVAVLVPTTILSLQHYNTFRSRLENFPCNIEYVSRLRTAKEISSIRERLKNGRIDILIGTHKILSDEFVFKDLGLLIIDEEQKFGVSAKEKLRQLKSSVDTLTMTATPIPRTLQFSLLGARDLSVISTPPPNRIPVQTEIMLFDKKEITGIINYELNRNGQIFFIHNKVEELDGIAQILHNMVPDMRICVAHGKMESKVLENKILDFMDGGYDLLLCTTIIENGLDIPDANTIIINRAQNFGLSELHQLRGRVGRSNRRAFCYLIVPPLVSITDDARRRLKAIESFSDLGSGFNIAMQDLDIRGAGNLLGAEQSGYITDMGLETYQKILEEAMEELGVETGIQVNHSGRDGKFTFDTTVETDLQALIPDCYMDVTAEKIRIYKELDSLPDEEGITRMKERMEDRFGTVPVEVERLFDIVRIRQIAGHIGMEKVIVKNGIMIAFFISNQMSAFYTSDRFRKVMENINAAGNTYEFKVADGKIKLICRKVDSLSKARELLSRL